MPRPGWSLARLWGDFSGVPADWPWLGTPMKATEKAQRCARMCAPTPIPPPAQRLPPPPELTPCKVLGPVAGDRGRQKGDTSQQPRQAETSHPRTWGGRGIRHRWFETRSPTRSTRSPSLNTSLTEPSWGGTRFSETAVPGRTCGRPRPQEATARPRPLRPFYAGPTPGHLAQPSLPVTPMCGPASTWLLESPAGGAGPVRWLHWNANDRKVGT